MSKGKPPPLPDDGSAEEMAKVYLQCVGLYKISEDKNAALGKIIKGKAK